jgi:Cytochrome c oxidase assembly protein CtaG/Cox11
VARPDTVERRSGPYSDPTTQSGKTVTVAFDSNVAPDLPWRFAPEQRSVTVHLGEQKLVFFTAENLGNEPIVAHATFNVTPAPAASISTRSNASVSMRSASVRIRKSKCLWSSMSIRHLLMILIMRMSIR